MKLNITSKDIDERYKTKYCEKKNKKKNINSINSL